MPGRERGVRGVFLQAKRRVCTCMHRRVKRGAAVLSTPPPPVQKDGQGERPAPGMDATFPLQCCPSKYCTTELRGQKAGLTKRNDEERRSAAPNGPSGKADVSGMPGFLIRPFCSCKLSRVGFGKRVLLPSPQACRKGELPVNPSLISWVLFPQLLQFSLQCPWGSHKKNPLFQPPPSPSFSLPSPSFVGVARGSHPLKPSSSLF